MLSLDNCTGTYLQMFTASIHHSFTGKQFFKLESNVSRGLLRDLLEKYIQYCLNTQLFIN